MGEGNEIFAELQHPLIQWKCPQQHQHQSQTSQGLAVIDFFDIFISSTFLLDSIAWKNTFSEPDQDGLPKTFIGFAIEELG